MSTYRELLELAAKAAGVAGDILFSEPSGLPYVATAGGVWSPLTDDGDALRLAVKLGIDLQLFRAIPQEFRPHDRFARACVDRLGRCCAEQVVDDPYAATRRAIVRAAAELGRKS